MPCIDPALFSVATIHVSYGKDSREVNIHNAFVKNIGVVKSIVAAKFTDIPAFPKQFDLLPNGFSEPTNEVVANRIYNVKRHEGMDLSLCFLWPRTNTPRFIRVFFVPNSQPVSFSLQWPQFPQYGGGFASSL